MLYWLSVVLIIGCFATIYYLYLCNWTTNAYRNYRNNFDEPDEKRKYLWFVKVTDMNGNTEESAWSWGMYTAKCAYEVLPGWRTGISRACGLGGYTGTDQPYPNKPHTCEFRDWNCLPVFECVNSDKIVYRDMFRWTTLVIVLLHYILE